ncbi:hypothetical protein K438DRAFT_1767166 [Mycena galopus ATCC 62051]|nr:hypothetical protein K438DRAFT_1767166 [Mycena galopus ATCC 62051]
MPKPRPGEDKPVRPVVDRAAEQRGSPDSLPHYSLAMIRQTHSSMTLCGTIFSVWTGTVNFAMLLSQAVALETGNQEDSKPQGTYPAKVEKIERKSAAPLLSSSDSLERKLLVDSKSLFTAMNIGLTYGEEQKFPTRMDNNQYTNLDVATELLTDDDVTCLATYYGFRGVRVGDRAERIKVGRGLPT